MLTGSNWAIIPDNATLEWVGHFGEEPIEKISRWQVFLAEAPN
jgi:hypothetical protein